MKIATIVLSVLLFLSLVFCGILLLILGSTIDELNIATTQLSATKSQLYNTQTELISTQTQLAATQLQLGSTQASLTVTTNQLESTKLLLQDTESQLSFTKTQLTAAKNEKTFMLGQYSDLKRQVNIRLGQGQDTQKFITPDDLTVIAKATEITGGYVQQDWNKFWRDYKSLYDWVVKNIKYSYDSYSPVIPEIMGSNIVWARDCWRMPSETLENKVGDCEDMAVLLASLMLSYNNDGFAVWALEIENKDVGHLAVAFPVAGNKLTILDPAGNYYTGYYYGGFRSDDTAVAVNAWLSYLAKEMPSAHISGVFSNKFYHEFANSEEFINWTKN